MKMNLTTRKGTKIKIIGSRKDVLKDTNNIKNLEDIEVIKQYEN